MIWFLLLIFVTLAARDFIDNRALRDCAVQLKRIADALNDPKPAKEPIAGVVGQLGRIADAAEQGSRSLGFIEENTGR